MTGRFLDLFAGELLAWATPERLLALRPLERAEVRWYARIRLQQLQRQRTPRGE
jgi:hypothetical protein